MIIVLKKICRGILQAQWWSSSSKQFCCASALNYWTWVFICNVMSSYGKNLEAINASSKHVQASTRSSELSNHLELPCSTLWCSLKPVQCCIISHNSKIFGLSAWFCPFQGDSCSGAAESCTLDAYQCLDITHAASKTSHCISRPWQVFNPEDVEDAWSTHLWVKFMGGDCDSDLGMRLHSTDIRNTYIEIQWDTIQIQINK